MVHHVYQIHYFPFFYILLFFRSSQDQEELTRLNSFHRLLLIRCTRVDRLRQVMRTCVKERFGELFEGSSETFSQTLPSITQSVPVFVLQSAQSSMNSSCQSQPREVIRNLAKVSCKLIQTKCAVKGFQTEAVLGNF